MQAIQPEMSEFESAFLCGLIKKFKPKKILEIGVSAGGTTPIILQCLEDNGQKYEMYSIDVSEKFYRDTNQESGFIAKYAKNNVFVGENALHGEHKFLLGTTLPLVIDEIGDEIDFVVLDTMHSLPGEVLDFLVVLPYLKSDAVICMHDVSYCQTFHAAFGHATGVLFSAVSADKFLNFILDNTLQLRYPNIAAFQINSDTMKNIANVFLTLILRWMYLPEQKDFTGYAEKLMSAYPAENFTIFQEAARMNIQNMILAQQQNQKN